MQNLTDKQRTLLIAGVGTVATATMIAMCITVSKLTKLLLS